MLAFLISACVIAISEMGDKTQFIALCLATRLKRPIPILLGILAATLASNLAAGLLGLSVSDWLHGNLLHCILAGSFLATSIRALIPDKLDELPEPGAPHGIFFASFMSFLLAEMGDKTQVTAMTLAAHFQAGLAVILGTTLGMMMANLPVVLLGPRIISLVPLKFIRYASGLLFLMLALYELKRLA